MLLPLDSNTSDDKELLKKGKKLLHEQYVFLPLWISVFVSAEHTLLNLQFKKVDLFLSLTIS